MMLSCNEFSQEVYFKLKATEGSYNQERKMEEFTSELFFPWERKFLLSIYFTLQSKNRISRPYLAVTWRHHLKWHHRVTFDADDALLLLLGDIITLGTMSLLCTMSLFGGGLFPADQLTSGWEAPLKIVSSPTPHGNLGALSEKLHGGDFLYKIGPPGASISLSLPQFVWIRSRNMLCLPECCRTGPSLGKMNSYD